MSKSITVLTVDDDAINNKLIESVLLKSGHIRTVLQAKNGADALQILEQDSSIDIVLLDIVMPIMGGMQTIEAIRSSQCCKDIPIIVLTTDETKRTQAITLGANDFMQKPINATLLLEKIQTLLEA